MEETTTAPREEKQDNSNVIPRIDVSKDAVSPEDSTELSTSPAKEENIDNENRDLDEKSPTMGEASNTNNDQIPLDTTITPGADGEVLASTSTRDRSASIQDLELSSLSSDGNKRPLQKSKSSMGSFKKVTGYSLRASFRSNFRKNKQNGSVISLQQQGEKPYDTASMVSQCSDTNSYVDETGSNSGLCHEEDESSNSYQLNREKSRSTLSVTSFTRLNHSLRLSSKKASQVLRRIGSKKEKVSRSETSTPEPSRRLHYSPQVADTSPIPQLKSAEDNNDAQPIHSTPVSSAPGEDSLNFTPNIKKSIRSMFRPRALRNFSSPEDSSARGTAQHGENESSVDESEGSSSIHSQKAPQNPAEIENYLSSLGKAHLKAELLAYTRIPIKVSEMTNQLYTHQKLPLGS